LINPVSVKGYYKVAVEKIIFTESEYLSSMFRNNDIDLLLLNDRKRSALSTVIKIREGFLFIPILNQ